MSALPVPRIEVKRKGLFWRLYYFEFYGAFYPERFISRRHALKWLKKQNWKTAVFYNGKRVAL